LARSSGQIHQRRPERASLLHRLATAAGVQQLLRPPGEHATDLPPFPLDPGNHHAVAASPGEHLRRHEPKNVKQHYQTVEQLQPDELRSHLEWFRALPLWLDLDGLRVVRACWDDRAIERIAAGLDEYRGITTAFLEAACKKGAPLFAPVDITLKGKEAKLPPPLSFTDKDGHVRTEIRTRWYWPAEGHTYSTYAPVR
jgi:hypothetical protein